LVNSHLSSEKANNDFLKLEAGIISSTDYDEFSDDHEKCETNNKNSKEDLHHHENKSFKSFISHNSEFQGETVSLKEN